MTYTSFSIVLSVAVLVTYTIAYHRGRLRERDLLLTYLRKVEYVECLDERTGQVEKIQVPVELKLRGRDLDAKL